MSLQPVPIVRESELGHLDEIGDGGQGKVFRTQRADGALFKQYFDPSRVNAKVFENLIAFFAGLPPKDRVWISRRAALPTALVRGAGGITGFLMEEARPIFLSQIGRDVKLRELAFLTAKPMALWRPLDLPNAEGRIEILKDLARLVNFLHDHKLIIGDMSGKNIIWSNDENDRLFLLDCDGLRFSGGEPAFPVAETPDWNDPAIVPGQPPSMESDRYKLAMVVHRTVVQRPRVRPEDAVPDSSVPHHVWDLLAKVASDGRSSRPRAEAWLDALDGRSRISLPPLKTRKMRRATLPAGPRPQIRLQKG